MRRVEEEELPLLVKINAAIDDRTAGNSRTTTVLKVVAVKNCGLVEPEVHGFTSEPEKKQNKIRIL